MRTGAITPRARHGGVNLVCDLPVVSGDDLLKIGVVNLPRLPDLLQPKILRRLNPGRPAQVLPRKTELRQEPLRDSRINRRLRGPSIWLVAPIAPVYVLGGI